jgi:high-affinity iron transporter
MAAALLSFREGLEAALIVGIVLGYLNKVGQADRARSVWAGVVTACLVSLVVAIALFALGAKLEGPAEEIFEGVTMLLAAAILTWMIFWMQRHGRTMKGDIERSLQVDQGQSAWALFSLAFLAVVREGIELALFLTAAVFAAGATATLLGAIAGLAAAILVGWLVFVSARRLNIQKFFVVSSLLLLIFAAGLVGMGIHELNEAGIVPSVVEHVWSTKSVLDDKSTGGSILKALVGYNDDPSLTQVIAYVGYAVVVIAALFAQRKRALPTPAV